MTLVSPGPVKDDGRRRLLMDSAEVALSQALRGAGFAVLERSRRDGCAGPEALYAVAASPLELKALAVKLEDSMSWGRLLDADVLVAPAGRTDSSDPSACSLLPEPLSRFALGIPPRRCLLCGNDARTCMAERAHPTAELAAAAELLLDILTLRPSGS